MARMLVLILIGVLLVAVTPALAGPSPSASNTNVYLTAQRFDRGIMIYRADTGYIWAVFDDGTTYGFPSISYGALPDNPIFDGPTYRPRPINGFGRVWGNHDWVRSKLGWAILPEYGFSARIVAHDLTVYIIEINDKIMQISANNTWRYVSTIPNPPPDLIPGVEALNVTPDPVNAGDTIIITWAVRNTEMALIEIYNAAGEMITFFDNLPLTGEVYVSVPITEAASLRVVVWGANRPHFYVPVTMYERVVSAEVVTGVTPYPPHTDYAQAAYQRYERGFMIWRADTGAVLVFTGSQGGQTYEFAESDYGTRPDNTITNVPAGFIVPISGFGKVWGNHDFVRDQLGWATGPEQAYEMTIESYGSETGYLLPEGRTALVTWRNFWTLK